MSNLKTILISIPYHDDSGQRQRVNMEIVGTIDRRRMMRGIRQFIQKMFNKRVGKQWIRMHCTIIKDFQGLSLNVDKPSQQKLDDICMQFMEQADEDEETNTELDAVDLA